MIEEQLDNILAGYDEEKEEPKEWTMITALDWVLNEVLDSNLSNKFWEKSKNALDYLTKELSMTRMQVVVLAILIEYDEVVTWRGIANSIRCSRLSIMKYSDEIEALVKRRWLQHSVSRKPGDYGRGFILAKGVESALMENRPFVPEKIDGLDLDAFIKRVMQYCEDNVCVMSDTTYTDKKDWVLMMCEANSHLALCREALNFKNDLDALLFFMLVVSDYGQWGGTEYEGFNLANIENVFPDDFEMNCMKTSLRNGTHRLIEQGLIEHTCVDGMANSNSFVLTRRIKEELFKGFTPEGLNCKVTVENERGLILHSNIKEKAMFYNKAEQQQIERLTSLLSQENFPSIQQRLEEQGLRKGFACLFYGAPGTGKTETVLQIARRTGRDIIQVDIASMRDKYVGESEKNIKAVFERYRESCKNREVMPILLFNEADALINKRTENVEKSVDKMDNAMQNIILQEMENLEGILIATTNLTSNLDKAFERRFLFKVEFRIPDVSVKQQLWCSMLQGLTEEEAHRLAVNYNFSGGQIENIARQRAIDFILSGKQLSAKDIEEYCEAENMGRRSNKRPVIGFR